MGEVVRSRVQVDVRLFEESLQEGTAASAKVLRVHYDSGDGLRLKTVAVALWSRGDKWDGLSAQRLMMARAASDLEQQLRTAPVAALPINSLWQLRQTFSALRAGRTVLPRGRSTMHVWLDPR